MNSKGSLADVMKMEVNYHGMNAVGQFCFANGTPLVSDVFPTIEAAVERFGGRINTRDKELRNSTQFAAGLKAAEEGMTRERFKSMGPQAQLEYDLGYMSGLKKRASSK